MICPECHAPWFKNPSTEVSPEEGDMTICGGCGSVLRFGRFGASLKHISARDEAALRKSMRELMRQQ